jgi:hypothetical protein
MKQKYEQINESLLQAKLEIQVKEKYQGSTS